ncbi:hypothetical protein CEXT_693161 [Caerostris extrusa]|uniref:Uncharacterized protein n=1 Tax=Caerostris extrusa TaxID=172846 RepID=A0AAV4T537_CAEEX|nr:hypothetical protein CEXT_693161 [Caerostris extrusa]
MMVKRGVSAGSSCAFHRSSVLLLLLCVVMATGRDVILQPPPIPILLQQLPLTFPLYTNSSINVWFELFWKRTVNVDNYTEAFLFQLL